MATEANKNKTKKKYFVTLIEACIIFFVSVAIATTEIPTSGFRGKRRSYQDRCFGYQRVITGAIEMYNMDHNEMIKDYNPDVYDLLRKENYLKGDLVDETECEFLVEGDLTGDGFIYCLNHGSIDRKKEGKDIEASLTPKKDSRERLKKNLIKLLVAFGPTILFFAHNAYIIPPCPATFLFSVFTGQTQIFFVCSLYLQYVIARGCAKN